MTYRDKIIDRQIGRNAELFALAVGEKATKEERYPLVRILVSILEQARPEWNQSPHKDRQIAHFVFKMSKGAIPMDETAEIVRLRDMERGFVPLPERPEDAAAEAAPVEGGEGADAAVEDRERADAAVEDGERADAAAEGRDHPSSSVGENAASPDAGSDGPTDAPQVDLFDEGRENVSPDA